MKENISSAKTPTTEEENQTKKQREAIERLGITSIKLFVEDPTRREALQHRLPVQFHRHQQQRSAMHAIAV